MNLSAIEHSNNTKQRRQVYVPASVTVIEVSAHKVICTSGGTENSEEGDTTDWWPTC